MADNSILKINSEELYFKEQAEKSLNKIREEAKKEATKAYCDNHKNHCFRCGTHSLVEVMQDKIHIDICINEGCGAVHLDPGELEKLLQVDQSIFGKIKNSIFSTLK